MRVIIGPPAKHHLNGVSLACRWWPNIECWLGSFVILKEPDQYAKKPYFSGVGSAFLWIRPWAIWHEKTISVNSSLSLIAIAYTFANMSYKLFWISEIHFTNSNYQFPTILSNGGRQPELLIKISSGSIKGLDTPSQNRKIATKIHFFPSDVKSIRR